LSSAVLLRPKPRWHPGAALDLSYTQLLWMRVERKAAYLPG
jgi:hypothetical protein